MRRLTGGGFLILLLTALLILAPKTDCMACVGKTLVIGIVNTPEEQVYAELISQLVTERTGTTVKILPFTDVGALYAAVRKRDVSIVIENTERGMKILDRPSQEKGRPALEVLKREFRKNLDLVWLDPVPGNGENRLVAPVISAETIENLPALPKLINRLSTILTEDSYARLVRSSKGEDKPRRVARDFLKAKKLI